MDLSDIKSKTFIVKIEEPGLNCSLHISRLSEKSYFLRSFLV